MEQLLIETLETKPSDATHWSTRTLGKHVAVSHSTVGRTWRAFGLQAHRSETFKLSRDLAKILGSKDQTKIFA